MPDQWAVAEVGWEGFAAQVGQWPTGLRAASLLCSIVQRSLVSACRALWLSPADRGWWWVFTDRPGGLGRWDGARWGALPAASGHRKVKALPANRPLKRTLGAGPHEISPPPRSLAVALFPLNLETPRLALSSGRRGPVAHWRASLSSAGGACSRGGVLSEGWLFRFIFLHLWRHKKVT